MSSILLYYDGQLSVSADFNPSYSGGRNRPLRVNNVIPLQELKFRIINALRRDPEAVTVNLIGRIRNNGGYTATIVDDDEVCEFILTEARRRNVIVYVEFVDLPCIGTAASPQPSEPNNVEICQPVPTIRPQHVNLPAAIVFENDPFIGSFEVNDSTIVDLPSSSMFMTQGEQSQHCADSDERESLSCGSDSSSSDDGNPANECNTHPNIHTHEHVRDHAFRNISNFDDMVMNNEFVHAIQTAEEWDATDALDGPDTNNTNIPWTSFPEQLCAGLTFPTKIALQFAICGWSITNNVEYVKTCSNNSRLTLICSKHDDEDRPCLWRLHASRSKRLRGHWIISTYGDSHRCFHPVVLQGNRNCTSKFICYYITGVLRHQIDLKPREIVARLESKFNIKISYSKAWNARQKAICSVFGSYEESYCSLSRLMQTISSSNVGTVYNIKHDEARRFVGLFWCFGASIEGWRFCRPVLSLDGTFLLGKYRGTLLAAVGFDGNGGLYPLAFAVVDSESTDSWAWFMQMLFHLVPPVRNRHDLCFISDKHPGLVRACREIFPHVPHRHCLRHLRENFKKAARRLAVPDCETICNKMYNAGNTDDIHVFNRSMLEIKEMNSQAYDWLHEMDFTKWTLTHDNGCRYGVMTTNASECFNGVLRRARGLPIQGLVVAIYYNLIAIFLKRSNNATHWMEARNSDNVPRITNLLRRHEEAARRCTDTTCINNQEFQVFEMSNRSFRVDILSETTVACTCQKPQIYHYPCHHAIAAASYRRWDYNVFVSQYYTLRSYKEAYAPQFHTLPDKAQWPPFDEGLGIIPLLPPPVRRRPGRPRSARYKNTMDEVRTQSGRHCGLCRQTGHNRSRCPLNPSSSTYRRFHS